MKLGEITMLRKVIAIMALGLMMNTLTFAVQNQDEKDIKKAEEVKSAITKLGTGTDAKVKVTLKDGTKIKGYVTEIKADSFVVMNEKTGTTVEVSYLQTKQVKGRNSLNGTIIGIGAAIAIGIIILILIPDK